MSKPGTPEEALRFLISEHPDAFETCVDLSRRISPHHAYLLFAAHAGAAAAATELERDGQASYGAMEKVAREIFRFGYFDYTREQLTEEMVAVVEGGTPGPAKPRPTELELLRARVNRLSAENARLKKLNRALSKLDNAVRNDLFAGRQVSEETMKAVRSIDAVARKLAVELVVQKMR